MDASVGMFALRESVPPTKTGARRPKLIYRRVCPLTQIQFAVALACASPHNLSNN